MMPFLNRRRGTTMPAVKRAAVRGVTVLALAALTATGCGGGGSGSTDKVPGKDALAKAKGVTTVTFWHAMDGANGETLTKLVDTFNSQHTGKIKVKAVYQGKYDDAITKYKASVRAKKTPSMIQVYDIGTRFMIDSKQTLPMQGFIDRDKYPADDLQPNITGYYSIDNKLYSMPFNTSMPVLYYNKTAFKKAGLDPSKPPKNLDEVRADAQKLTLKSGGKTTQYGFGAAIYGWFLEQWAYTAGQEYCDNGNGRKAEATQMNYTQPTEVNAVDWWAKMVKDGYATNTGRDTSVAQKAFEAGRVAMNLESTGELRVYQTAAQARHFDLGVGFYPSVAARDGGPSIGGASLWIDGPGHSAAEQEASWEFVKYLASAQTQATWHTGTGYFPINKKALDVPADQQWRKQYPQFDVAIQQLDQTKLTTATQGCLLGVMPQARAASEDAIESAITGQSDAKTALTAAAKKIGPQIADYNRATK